MPGDQEGQQLDMAEIHRIAARAAAEAAAAAVAAAFATQASLTQTVTESIRADGHTHCRYFNKHSH